jgi:hypothetical protein
VILQITLIDTLLEWPLRCLRYVVRDVLAICQLHRIMASEGRRQGGGVGCKLVFRQRATVNRF